MYFQQFPTTLYSLDDRQTVQVVRNFLLRTVIADAVKNNYSVYEIYDIKDGETPENLAFQFYGDSNLHWIILQMNEILDPRFDWPLDTYTLKRFCEGKYSNINAVHHFEDSQGNEIGGNVLIYSNSQFGILDVGDVIKNNTNVGIGYVTEINSLSNVSVRVTSGGFQSGNQILNLSNTGNTANATANITTTSILSGIPVTNFVYEDRLNETRRRIKILKPRYVEQIVKDFENKLSQVNV